MNFLLKFQFKGRPSLIFVCGPSEQPPSSQRNPAPPNRMCISQPSKSILSLKSCSCQVVQSSKSRVRLLFSLDLEGFQFNGSAPVLLSASQLQIGGSVDLAFLYSHFDGSAQLDLEHVFSSKVVPNSSVQHPLSA